MQMAGLLVNRTQCSCRTLLAQLLHQMLFSSVAALQQLLLTLPPGRNKDGSDGRAAMLEAHHPCQITQLNLL